MKNSVIIPFVLFAAFAAGSASIILSSRGGAAENDMIKYPKIPVTYPSVAKGTVVDTFFGTAVADPYRWLEDENSAETKSFVVAQNEVTANYLSKISFRDSIRQRLTALYNYERYGAPTKEGGKYYFFKNDGLQNQSVMYMQDAAGDKVVLDPNTLSTDGTVSVSGTEFSHDGRYMAYQISDGGSDWQTILIKDMTTGQDLKDEIKWVKFSGVGWYGDGFFYSRFPEAKDAKALSAKNQYHKIYYHKIGDAQSKDELVYEAPEHPDRFFGAATSFDQRFLIIGGSESTSGSNLTIRDLTAADKTYTTLVDNFDNDYNVVGTKGDDLYVLTNNKSPRYRVVRINAKDVKPESWAEVIPESKDVLQSVSYINDKLVCSYLHDAASVMKIYDLTGKLVADVALPGIGTASGAMGKANDPEAFYSFSSFNRPTTIYKLDANTGKSEIYRAPKLSFNPDEYTTEQVFYASKDGTKIPMFITHKKGLKKDKNRPTLLYGYGGFNISVTPSYPSHIMALLEKGGIYAVANIRGGGEYGEEWHKAGTLQNKQNVFDDFIAAAEYLIAQNYTCPARLGVEGRSNGGLLVGAVQTQRPDLFGVCFPGVGVLDMLRYHQFTIGYAWATDYGRSDQDEAMFKYLHKYSPVHNCKPANYPATMIITADHDDRVVPAHSFKYAAALQAAQTGEAPVLVRIDTRAGHGAGKSIKMTIEERTDMLAFMFYNMGVKY